MSVSCPTISKLLKPFVSLPVAFRRLSRIATSTDPSGATNNTVTTRARVVAILWSLISALLLPSSVFAVDQWIPATIQWTASQPACNQGWGFVFATKEDALQCLIVNKAARYEYSGTLISLAPAQPGSYRAPGTEWTNYPSTPAIREPIDEIHQIDIVPSCPAGSFNLNYSATENQWQCQIHVLTTDQSQKPCDLCLNNPILPGTGNKRQDEIDYTGTGRYPLTFVRTYNSAPQFGSTWTHNFDRYITTESVGSEYRAAIHRAEGSFSFTLVGSAWVPDSDVNYQLQGSDSSFVVITPGGEREPYDSLNKVRAIQTLSASVNKYTLTYRFGTPHLLTNVADPFGHSLTFTYDAQNRLATMTDPAGGLYQYAYDTDGNLTSVTYPDSSVRQYRYHESAYTTGAPLTHALTGIVDESSARFANFGYDATGLAIMSEHAGGADRFTVSYTSPPAVLEDSYVDVPKSTKYITKRYQAPTGVTATDAFGQVRHYSFTAINGAVKTTSSDVLCSGVCSNIPQARTFDANGNVASKTDFEGNVTTYSYDLARNLETSRTEAYGTALARTITTQWNATYRTPTQIDEPGRRTTYTHDSLGNVLTRTVLDTATSESRTWTYTYDGHSHLLTANGPRTDVSDVTTYAYYACNTGSGCGQIQTITNAAGHVTTYNTYNAYGRPLTVTDPNGVVTTLTYDSRQRLLSRTVGAEVTSFTYWPTGLLKKATLPDGSYLEYTYDAAHRLTGINDQEGNRVAYTLDAMGNRTTEESFDPSNVLARTRTQVFNNLNQLQQTIGAAGTPAVTTDYAYDANGNQTDIDAPLSRSTTQGYDELNRLASLTDPGSGVTQYGYNALDQLISVTDPRTLTTSYTYNALGDLGQQISPDTGTTTNTFDSGGNLKTSADARSAITTYTYDVLNRLLTADFKIGVTTSQTITYSMRTLC